MKLETCSAAEAVAELRNEHPAYHEHGVLKATLINALTRIDALERKLAALTPAPLTARFPPGTVDNNFFPVTPDRQSKKEREL